MRCCWLSAARVLTLFSLALFSSKSLLLVTAQSTDLVDIPHTDDTVSSTATSPAPSSSSLSSSPSPSTTSTPPQVTTSSVTPSSTPVRTRPSTSTTSSSTSTPAQETSTTQTPSPSPTSTTPAPAAFATETSSTSSSSTSSSSSSSSSVVSTSSSSAIPTTSSSSPGVTLVNPTGTTLVAAATTDALATDDSATSYTWSVSPSSVATGTVEASSSKSFFDNKGAVAGTFTAVGAAVVGIIIVAVVISKRRAARLQDEEDMTYFEKYDGPNGTNASAANDGTRTPTDPDMSFVGQGGMREMDVNDEPLATHAAPDAYPDRAMHFGLPTMEEYTQPQAMGLDFSSAVDYPPGTSYDPTQYAGYQGYDPAQHTGYEGYNAAQYAGYENAYAQPQQPYYSAPYSTQSMPAHPYANPTNSLRVAGAPPVQQLYGEAS